MSILVVGSVAFDAVETPAGKRAQAMGGSATHFSMAASFFSTVRLVAVVGEDFSEEHRKPLLERGVDLAGLRVAPGKTFRWEGEYRADDWNNARTIDTQLNVFAGFRPEIDPAWRETPVLFLANIDPELQEAVLDQMAAPRLVALDTMNFWIESKRDALLHVLRRVGILLINDMEIRQLTRKENLLEAAELVREIGPRVVVVKRGEHGVLVVSADDLFAMPAYPRVRLVDPTGAGDTFAGGFLGHLAGIEKPSSEDCRRAAAFGSVMASFQCEDFSFDRTRRLAPAEIEERYDAFDRLTRIPPRSRR